MSSIEVTQATKVDLSFFRQIRQQLSMFQELSKSGIVALVLISVLGGYLAGQPFETELSWLRLTVTLFGILFLASGSSALNQLQERHIDAQMPRTAKRPLPSGRITPAQARNFIAITLGLGLVLLYWVDWQLLILGGAAVISYNFLYTLWWKKHWAYAAVPGAIPGALPILMGYAAADGNVWTPGGLYLFFILFYWQMPHFWVLALRFQGDYEKGGIPTLPVARGEGVTLSQIILWCLAYVGLAMVAPFFIDVGSLYLSAALLISGKVLWELWSFAKAPDQSKHWLRFFLWVNFSLILYLAVAVIDLWSIYLVPYLTR